MRFFGQKIEGAKMTTEDVARKLRKNSRLWEDMTLSQQWKSIKICSGMRSPTVFTAVNTKVFCEQQL